MRRRDQRRATWTRRRLAGPSSASSGCGPSAAGAAAGRRARPAARPAAGRRRCRAWRCCGSGTDRAVAAPAGTATPSPSGCVPGGRPLVLFARPEHAKEIFAGDPAVFHAGKGNAILGPIMGEHSLLLQDGGDHQRARKLLMPAFNGHALQGLPGAGRARSPRAEVAALARRRDVPGAGPDERAHPRGDPRASSSASPTRRRLAALRPRVKPTVEVGPAVAARLGLPVAAAVRPVAAHGRERLRAGPPDLPRDPRAPRGARPRRAHRRALPADPGGGRRRTPCPTSSSATSWSRCCWPGTRPRRPRWRGRCTSSAATPRSSRRARRAAADGDDDWLEAVLKESMRLHPVIPMVVRTLMAPATDRRLRPAGRHDRRAVDPARPPARGEPPGPRTVRPGAVRRAATRPPTPGSPSAAASAAASAPASR